MKKLIILLCITFSSVIYAQVNQDISVFHRLVIYNADNNIMLVKIKDKDVWVTPGFYQDSIQFPREGLHDIAATYGMTISSPELKGTFSMRLEAGEMRDMRVRNIYTCNYLSGDIHFPENQSFEIDEIKWLPMEEALPLIPFEPVRLFLKQTDDYPDYVWGGSITGIREGVEWEYEITEDFYPLFSPKE